MVSLLLALAVAPLPAGGQATDATAPAGPVRLEDALNDVSLTVQGSPVGGVAGSVYPGADLASLTVTEQRSDFAIVVGVARLPTAQDPGVDGVRYQVFFTHNGREFELRIAFTLTAVGGGPVAYLLSRDSPAAEWSILWVTDGLTLDTSANTVAVDVPRELLVDADGAAPFPGRLLETIHAAATSAFSGADIQVFLVPVATPYEVRDVMPDDPGAAPSLAVALGVQQSGDARLYSPMPFRASNGEATTFIYNVSVVNLSPDNTSFELTASQVPAGYTLVLPVPLVFVEGGSSAEVPVLFTMPFGHAHGSLSSFTLEAHSLADPNSVGRIEMGVRFLATPQPAGHHDTVYLHSASSDSAVDVSVFGGPYGYLNTLEQDPNDIQANLYANGFSMMGVGEWGTQWTFPLSPGLEMGLDVDAGKVGQLRIPLGTTIPLLQAQVEAALYAFTVETSEDDEEGQFFFFGEPIPLARMESTAPVDITGGTVLIEGPLVPEGELRVPYQPGNQLFLVVRLDWVGPNSFGLADETPYIAPGGSAVLPLREWHDAVDAVLSTVGGPSLIALGPQERLVNPGEAVVFPVSVSNPLDEDVDIVVEVSGSNAAWATLPASSLVARAHETVTASVVVRAPPGSVDQERADLVLQAYSEDNPAARGLLRLVAEVDTDEDQADDSAVAAGLEKKDTPGLGAAALAGALACLALARTRRRR